MRPHPIPSADQPAAQHPAGATSALIDESGRTCLNTPTDRPATATATATATQACAGRVTKTAPPVPRHDAQRPPLN